MYLEIILTIIFFLISDLFIFKEGMTTEDLDEIVHNFIIENGAYPSPI